MVDTRNTFLGKRHRAAVYDSDGNRLHRAGFLGLLDRRGLSTVLYCVALVAWLAMAILDQTYFAVYFTNLIHRSIRIACVLLLFLGEFIDWRARGISTRSIVAFALACLLGVTALFANMNMQIDAILFVFCVRNRDIVLVGKVFLAASVSLLLFVVISSFAGVVENTLELRNRDRAYLGFRFALYPAAYLFAITLLSLCLSGRRFIVPTSILLVVSNAAMFMFTDGRLSFALALGAILLSLLGSFSGRRFFLSKPMGVLFTSCFVLAAVVSVVVAVMYSADIGAFEAVNSFFGKRLEYGQRALAEYGVTLFGQDVQFVGAALTGWGERYGGEYFYLDNIYLRILVEYGIVGFVLYLTGYTLCIFKAWKSGNVVLAIALSAVATHGVVDNLMLYLWYCPFILLIGSLFQDPGVITLSDQKGGS